MRVSFVAVLLLSALAAPATAQSAAPARYEIAGGYARLRDQDIADSNPEISSTFPTGWMIGAGVGVRQWLEAVGEVGGSHKTVSIPGDEPKLRLYTFMAGPRATARRTGSVAPFAQVLFGAARASTIVVNVTDTVTDFAWQPGGGVNVNVRRRVGVRVEGDYRIVRAAGRNSKEARVVGAAFVTFGR